MDSRWREAGGTASRSSPKLSRYRNSAPTEDVPLPAPGDTVDPEVRIRARSASDDKGPIVAMLAALDAMKALKKTPSVNVKFFLEGEEEAGSNHLGDMLRTHKDKLAADAWLFFDGPVHVSGRAAAGARRARRDGRRSHLLRRQPCAAQRPLRQLGAQPRSGVSPIHRRHA
jgi:hypothetical protein